MTPELVARLCRAARLPHAEMIREIEVVLHIKDAELAAERAESERARKQAAKLFLEGAEAAGHRDRLREALLKARPYINHQNGNTAWDMLAAVDAVLKETKGCAHD
jgi:hypothetical protein